MVFSIKLGKDRRLPVQTGFIVILASMLSFNTFADEGDGVTAMCLGMAGEAECDCATRALRDEVSAEDFELYDAIGADYMARRDSGEDMSAAWSAASKTQAERLGAESSGLTQRTNVIGRAHRDAIKACTGES